MNTLKQWLAVTESTDDDAVMVRHPLRFKVGDWTFSGIAREIGRIRHHEQSAEGNFYTVQWHDGTLTQDVPEMTLQHATAPPVEHTPPPPPQTPSPPPDKPRPSPLIGDVIKGRTPITIDPTMSITTAAEWIAQYNIGALPVMAGGNLVGMVSERDIAAKIVATGKSPQQSIATIMTRHPVTLSNLDSLATALKVMRKGNFRHVPITADEKVIGILSMKDVLAALADTE